MESQWSSRERIPRRPPKTSAATARAGRSGTDPRPRSTRPSGGEGPTLDRRCRARAVRLLGRSSATRTVTCTTSRWSRRWDPRGSIVRSGIDRSTTGMRQVGTQGLLGGARYGPLRAADNAWFLHELFGPLVAQRAAGASARSSRPGVVFVALLRGRRGAGARSAPRIRHGSREASASPWSSTQRSSGGDFEADH